MAKKEFKLFLSEADHTTLFAKSRQARISASEFLRKCIRGQEINVIPLGEDVISSLKDYLDSVGDTEEKFNTNEKENNDESTC